MALNKTILCKSCDGKGGKNVRKCSGCGGKGMKFITRQMGPMIQRFQTTCDSCHGSGDIMDSKDRCMACKGKKTASERKILQVNVDAGASNGQKIVFKGEGDHEPGSLPGDVMFIVDEKPHATFKRKNSDLLYDAHIDLLTALAGGELYVSHVSGETLKVTIIPGEVIHDNSVKVVEGKGMPVLKHGGFGDLLIKFSVDFPPNNFCSPEKLALLETILPPRKTVDRPMDEEVEDCVLTDFQPHRHGNQRQRGNQALDSDDEEQEGPQGVACQSQ